MPTYRITKYCPSLRSPDGAYSGDEWTYVAQIGQSFAGQELTVEQYLAIESAYVSAVRLAMQQCEITSLQISDSESPRILLHHLPLQLQEPTHALYQPISNGQQVAGQQLEAIIRLNLREALWCKLVGADGFYVHFGWDFYMYVGYDRDEPLPSELNGLYVESSCSPYIE